jgi:hypothetical protein
MGAEPLSDSQFTLNRLTDLAKSAQFAHSSDFQGVPQAVIPPTTPSVIGGVSPEAAIACLK